jgi:hypothetical protein
MEQSLHVSEISHKLMNRSGHIFGLKFTHKKKWIMSKKYRIIIVKKIELNTRSRYCTSIVIYELETSIDSTFEYKMHVL